MIEATGLTKRYGSRTAVDDLTFTVRPGQVTGFLGPNGAGKSTTMRMIVGLDRPSAGAVTVAGRQFREHRAPIQEVGALLDAKAAHRGRSAEAHLRALAATHGIGRSRVAEVIEMTGLSSVAKKRVGGFSLGMGQRLGIASALLGDPEVLVLDEPVNGLDPEGVRWVRELVRWYAGQGRTVLLSSHLMSEMAQTADHVLVIGRGKLLADTPIDALLKSSATTTRVRTPRPADLSALVAAAGGTSTPAADGALIMGGPDAAAIGDLAAGSGIALHELTPLQSSLEEIYMTMTADSVEYRTASGLAPGGQPEPEGALR
ncbi:MAG: ATP-binding cassette domain-containing protein [Naasia sp.]